MAEGEAPIQQAASWREIAEKISHETDAAQVLQLTQQLLRAFQENEELKKQSA